MSQWHAYIRAVFFHALHRCQRDTILYPYLVNFATMYSLPLSQTRSLLFILLCHSSVPSLSTAAAAAVYLAPAILMPACSHHSIPSRTPDFLSVASHSSRSYCVVMYCVTVFYLCWMYSSIASNPASALSATANVYSHLPSSLRFKSRPINCCATWSWNPHSTLPMRGVAKIWFHSFVTDWYFLFLTIISNK